MLCVILIVPKRFRICSKFLSGEKSRYMGINLDDGLRNMPLPPLMFPFDPPQSGKGKK